jgi:hypothetical protein
MELRDVLTLIALVVGPVSAVGISLWIEERRRVRDSRLRIIRMLLATRHLPAHADYNAAINLIPLEFNNCEEVMTAWRAYTTLVRIRPDQQADHQKRMEVAQARLIYEAMVASGLKLSEGDIQTTAYVSDGFANYQRVYIESLQAMPQIAETLKKQAALTEQLVNLAQRPNKDRIAPPIESTSGPGGALRGD